MRNTLTNHFKSLLDHTVLPAIFGSTPILTTFGFIHYNIFDSSYSWKYAFSDQDKQHLEQRNISIKPIEKLEKTPVELNNPIFSLFTIYQIYAKFILNQELSVGQRPLQPENIDHYLGTDFSNTHPDIKEFINSEKEMLSMLIDNFQAKSSFYYPIPIFHQNNENKHDELVGIIYLVYDGNTFEKGDEMIKKVYSHLIMNLSKAYDIALKNVTSQKVTHPSLKTLAPLGL